MRQLCEKALGDAREALMQKYIPRAVAYFETVIDRFVGELVEDLDRTVERRLLSDDQLDETIRGVLAEGSVDTDRPERLLLEIKRRQATLERIAAMRFRDGHVQTVAVPDGEGDYLIDSVGTPGRWEVFVTTGDQDRTVAASVTRLLDALCDIAFNEGVVQTFGQLPRGPAGDDDQVVVVKSSGEADAYVEEGCTLYRPSDPDFADTIAVERLKHGRLRLYVASRLLTLSRNALRGHLRDAFPSLAPAAPGTSEHRELFCEEVGPRDGTPPAVVMLDLSGTSGPYLVSHALEMRGIPVQLVKPGGRVTIENPNVFCISLATQPLGFAEVGTQIRALRELIDTHFPGAFIIVGGPSAKHPKTVMTLFPEINIVLRGEGEDVLPEALKIIGRTTTDRLSRQQIAELKTIDGLFLNTPGFMLFNNLDKVNTTRDFDVPVMFHYGSFSLFGGGGPIASRTIINPDIARGCPFRCSFCSMAMGWNQRYVAFERFQDYVLGMLAMEIPLPCGMEDAIAAALRTDASAGDQPRDDWFPADAYRFSREQLVEVLRTLDRYLSADLAEKGLVAEGTRLVADDVMQHSAGMVTRSQVNACIVAAKREWLAVLLDKGEDLWDHGLDHKLEILLEDDNTLTNRDYIEKFCRWVIDNGLNSYLRFGGGQTSVSSFMKQGEPNEAFIRLLREAGCCEVEMGVDGLSNNILNQNDKRGYRLGDAMRVIQMLAKWGINGASNRLYSAPYASRIDVVESLLLGALAPLGGHSLGGPFIITVPGSQYTNELAVNYPDRAANRTDFEQTYGEDYEYAWSRFPEYVPLEHHLYPFDPHAREITERFASVVKIQREDKHIYDSERRMGKMTHELGILEKLETEGLEDEIVAVIRRWQAPDQPDPELRALGEIIRIRRSGGADTFTIFREVLAETYSPTTPKTFTDVLRDQSR